MVEFLTTVLSETAMILYEGSLYILLGFVIAGFLHEFLPTGTIARHLGRDDPRSIATAALFGAPIPLCSCGVLPAAAALRKKGAGRSPTMAFLVSTPETGVDSIALTYGLFGGVMAVVRPVVAIVTAFVAGLLSMGRPQSESPEDFDLSDLAVHDHDHDHDHPPARNEAKRRRGSGKGRQKTKPAPELLERLERASRYGFVTLLDDLAFWLLVGIVLTGVLSAALPDDFFSTALGLDRGILPMLLVMIAGVPLYLCASASTPIAAALVAKGLSPGAALVFLLVGPATNAATIAVVGRLLGRRQLRIYLGSIIGVSLVAGLALDAVAADAIRGATLGAIGQPDGDLFGALKIAAAIAFTALLAWSGARTHFREGRRELREQGRELRRFVRSFEPARLRDPRLLAGGALVLALAFLPNAFLVVEAGQVGMVQRFGRVVEADLAPGLHAHWPPPIGHGSTVDVTTVHSVTVGAGSPDTRTDPSRNFYITADENLIDLRGVVHYRVRDPVRFAFGAEPSEGLLEGLARAELARLIAATGIDTLYTTERKAVEERFRQRLVARVAEARIGLEVVDARLLDVHAPGIVHDAFRDVASALEDRAREIHEGNAYAAERVTEARGETAAVRERAHADAHRAAVGARGATAAFVELNEVHARHPRVTEARLHFEMLDATLAAPRKYVRGAGSDGSEVDLWVGGATPEKPPEDGDDRAAPTFRRVPLPIRGNP